MWKIDLQKIAVTSRLLETTEYLARFKDIYSTIKVYIKGVIDPRTCHSVYAGLFDTLHHIKELTKADKSFPCKQKNLSVSCFCSFFLKKKTYPLPSISKKV